jgi:hypothetical protein
VFLALLLVYHATLLPTAVDQDSGELIAAVHVQGIPHPTGYPLWLLLGRLFDYLPLGGTSAYRVGLMSAVAVAAAGALVSLITMSLAADALAALFAGLAFGFWSVPWSDLVRAEVHALVTLLFSIALMALRRWDRERSARALLLLCLAAGFGAMHHRTALLAIAPAFLVAWALTPPRCRLRYLALGWLVVAAAAAVAKSQWALGLMGLGFAVMVIYALARRSRLRTYAAAVALLLAPFSLYGYLWLRALQQPPVRWTDTTTFDQLLHHALAKQYFQFAFANSFEQMLSEAAKLLPQLLAPGLGLSLVIAVIGLPLITWGGVAWLRKERLVAIPVAVGCLLVAFWVLRWGETSDLKHFLQPLAPTLAICFGLGLARLRGLLPVGGPGKPQPRWAPHLIAGLGLLLCGGLVRANWARLDLSDHWGPRDRWTAVLSQLAPHAIFISDFDQPSFFTMYLQNVEGLRPDVTLVRSVRLPTPLQPEDWYLNTISDLELRQALREEWPKALAYPAAGEIHNQSAVLAYLLAKRLPHRPIYAVHGPMGFQLPGPPYFLGLSEDLVRVSFGQPNTPRPGESKKPIAYFAGPGLSLLSLRLDRAQAGNGEMVPFTLGWRPSHPLPPAQFALGLVPEAMALQEFAARPWEKMRLKQPYPVAYAQWGLAPSPAATAYQQRGQLIIPSNAPPGPYRVAVGIAPLQLAVMDSRAYQDWTEVGRLRITPRPLPRNGP